MARIARPTLQAGNVDLDRGQAGFTLIEIICVLAIIGLMAAIVLPSIPHGTSRAELEAYALQTAALLESDRDTAIRRRTDIETVVDAASRSIRSGASRRAVHLPPDVTMQAELAARCAGRASESTIRHFASGMSCGGVIAMARNGRGFSVRVNWLTGGVQVAPLH